MANVTTPIVALDLPSGADALALVDRLGERCRFYKIGLELFCAEGPSIVGAVRARGADVFLDLKFHDIPNTVAGAVKRAVALGPKLLTIHASGGEAMIRAAVDAARGSGCGVLCVTVLTSLDAAQLGAAWGRRSGLDVMAEVLRLAELATWSGAHGVVCSGQEARSVQERHGDKLAILVPGVRLAGEATQDQARVVTPSGAAAAGARYIVVGRTVTAAPDPGAAMARVLGELGGS